MPDGLTPGEGIGDLLEYILKRDIAGVLPWQLILWTNDIVPDCDTVSADLTEADFTGYTRWNLDRAAWTTPVVTQCCAESSWGYDPIEWWVDDPKGETIYGYAMLDVSLDVIRFVQRFDAADIVPLKVGSRIKLLPRFTLTNAPCD